MTSVLPVLQVSTSINITTGYIVILWKIMGFSTTHSLLNAELHSLSYIPSRCRKMSHASDFRHHHHHHRSPAVTLREIEVLIISAQDLKNVKHVTKMRTYAVVYVQKSHVVKTHVDEHGGINPMWNEIVKVKFPEELPENDVKAALNVDIYAHGHVREKPVGSARVLLCDLLKGGDPSEPLDNPIQCLTVQIWRPSGRPHGLLNLWVPPTGRFLIRRDSLSFSVKETPEEESVAEVEVVRGGDEVEK